MYPHLHAAAFALLAAMTPLAAAAADRRPHPADADAPVPAAVYHSAFTEHRKPAADGKIDWRRANDAVREAGGHAGALKDAAPAQSPQAGMSRMQGQHHHGRGEKQ